MPQRLIAALDPMNKLFAILSWLGFGIAAVIHLLSAAGVDLADGNEKVWLMHFGCFVVFVPFVLLSRSISPQEAWDLIPKWAMLLMISLFLNALGSFAAQVHQFQGGVPSRRDGGYFLLSHGSVVQKLTEAEFHAANAVVLKGFSAAWLLFYSVPGVFFLLREKQA